MPDYEHIFTDFLVSLVQSKYKKRPNTWMFQIVGLGLLWKLKFGFKLHIWLAWKAFA